MADVEMYTKRYCSFCFAAKNLMQQKGVEYKEIPIDDDPQQREQMIERSGRRTVPQIFINGEHIGGFDDLSAVDKKGELDAMLAS